MATHRQVLVAHGVPGGTASVIIREAKRHELPLSLVTAVCDVESGFRNVFGHDPTIYAGAGKVTKPKYLRYRKAARQTGKRQGVGVTQLTAGVFQDAADRAGGCWLVSAQVHVACELLARLIASHGRKRGLASYNAGETGWRNGRGYAAKVQARMDVWHRRLT